MPHMFVNRPRLHDVIADTPAERKNFRWETINAIAYQAGGLIFIGGTMDGMVRAYNLQSGEELWSDLTEAPSVSNPAIYEHDGQEYVAFISGGNSILKPSVGDMISVYRLPL